jgi:hypothetical protein
MQGLVEKFKEVLYAVLPVTIIVIILHFTFTPIESGILGRFFIGTLFVWLGLSIFLIGVDLGITPMGVLFGKTIAKSKKMIIIILSGIGLGFLITIAEPDLLIVAKIVETMTRMALSQFLIVLTVALFIGIFVAIGMARILLRIPLHFIILGSYLIIGILALFVDKDLVGIAFDISGATTGAMAVPFILAIAVGIASLQRSGKNAEKDSFGLIGIASVGAIMAVLLILAIRRPDTTQAGIELLSESHRFGDVAKEALFALGPIFILSIFGNIFFFKISRRKFRVILFGFLFTYIGLTLFLFGVYSGFLETGRVLGSGLSSQSSVLVIITSFVLGVLAILAEPAVYILTQQINTVTAGSVPKPLVIAGLALGVGGALVLNYLRFQIDGLALWHILLPGYALALGLMFLTPKLFVGMGFDAGGVASGPIAATFIFAFSQGIAYENQGALHLKDAFGMIALIALVPILMVELLGILYKIKAKREVKRNA